MARRPDEGHRMTDQELAKLERRIAKLYKRAADDVQETVTQYFERFRERDEEIKKLIGTNVNGKVWTETDYKMWRIAQIGRGKRFEDLRDKLAERMSKANEIALAYANNEMPKIYALNHAYTIQNIVGKANGALDHIDWILLDEQTVKRLLVEQPDLMPYYPKAKALRRGIDLEWGKKKITANVTSGILQGKSVNQMARDLMNDVTDMNRASAVRAVRTAVTEAENAGRQAAADELESKGVILGKRWVATHDSRTRDAHIHADGQTVKSKEQFIVGGEKLMYPGDGRNGASGWNIYNCRCTSVREYMGFKSILSDEQRKRAKIKVEIVEK